MYRSHWLCLHSQQVIKSASPYFVEFLWASYTGMKKNPWLLGGWISIIEEPGVYKIISIHKQQNDVRRWPLFITLKKGAVAVIGHIDGSIASLA